MNKIKEQSLCPICEGNNHCEVDNKKGCWCISAEIPKKLLDKLADNEKNKRCICQACLDKFKLSKEI